MINFKILDSQVINKKLSFFGKLFGDSKGFISLIENIDNGLKYIVYFQNENDLKNFKFENLLNPNLNLNKYKYVEIPFDIYQKINQINVQENFGRYIINLVGADIDFGRSAAGLLMPYQIHRNQTLAFEFNGDSFKSITLNDIYINNFLGAKQKSKNIKNKDAEYKETLTSNSIEIKPFTGTNPNDNGNAMQYFSIQFTFPKESVGFIANQNQNGTLNIIAPKDSINSKYCGGYTINGLFKKFPNLINANQTNQDIIHSGLSFDNFKLNNNVNLAAFRSLSNGTIEVVETRMNFGSTGLVLDYTKTKLTSLPIKNLHDAKISFNKILSGLLNIFYKSEDKIIQLTHNTRDITDIGFTFKQSFETKINNETEIFNTGENFGNFCNDNDCLDFKYYRNGTLVKVNFPSNGIIDQFTSTMIPQSTYTLNHITTSTLGKLTSSTTKSTKKTTAIKESTTTKNTFLTTQSEGHFDNTTNFNNQSITSNNERNSNKLEIVLGSGGAFAGMLLLAAGMIIYYKKRKINNHNSNPTPSRLNFHDSDEENNIAANTGQINSRFSSISQVYDDLNNSENIELGNLGFTSGHKVKRQYKNNEIHSIEREMPDLNKKKKSLFSNKLKNYEYDNVSSGTSKTVWSPKHLPSNWNKDHFLTAAKGSAFEAFKLKTLNSNNAQNLYLMSSFNNTSNEELIEKEKSLANASYYINGSEYMKTSMPILSLEDIYKGWPTLYTVQTIENKNIYIRRSNFQTSSMDSGALRIKDCCIFFYEKEKVNNFIYGVYKILIEISKFNKAKDGKSIDSTLKKYLKWDLSDLSQKFESFEEFYKENKDNENIKEIDKKQRFYEEQYDLQRMIFNYLLFIKIFSNIKRINLKGHNKSFEDLFSEINLNNFKRPQDELNEISSKKYKQEDEDIKVMSKESLLEKQKEEKSDVSKQLMEDYKEYKVDCPSLLNKSQIPIDVLVYSDEDCCKRNQRPEYKKSQIQLDKIFDFDSLLSGLINDLNIPISHCYILTSSFEQIKDFINFDEDSIKKRITFFNNLNQFPENGFFKLLLPEILESLYFDNLYSELSKLLQYKEENILEEPNCINFKAKKRINFFDPKFLYQILKLNSRGEDLKLNLEESRNPLIILISQIVSQYSYLLIGMNHSEQIYRNTLKKGEFSNKNYDEFYREKLKENKDFKVSNIKSNELYLIGDCDDKKVEELNSIFNTNFENSKKNKFLKKQILTNFSSKETNDNMPEWLIQLNKVKNSSNLGKDNSDQKSTFTYDSNTGLIPPFTLESSL